MTTEDAFESVHNRVGRIFPRDFSTDSEPTVPQDLIRVVIPLKAIDLQMGATGTNQTAFIEQGEA